MRIALVSYELGPDTLGGIATYACHAVAMLELQGHDVTVFSASPRKRGIREDTLFGASVVRLPCCDRCSFFDLAIPALVAEHAREPFDVAEVPDLYAEGRGLRAALPSLPIVLRAHTPLYIPRQIDYFAQPRLAREFSALRRLLGGLAHREPLRKTWQSARSRASWTSHYAPHQDAERQVALEADIIAPPSQRLAQRLRTDWKLPPERIRVLPYPHSPAPNLLALTPPTRATSIGFHGGVRYFKGIHVLVAAMQLVAKRHPQVDLSIAGQSGSSPVPVNSWRAWKADRMVTWSDTIEWLKPQLAALGNRVTLRGFIRPENLVTHLAAADVCVFPSLFDNFPSACLEAMSAGRAIIASRSGGMEEMIEDGVSGLLVAPGNVNQLAHAIIKMIETPGLTATLGRAARERVTKLYAPNVIAPSHIALYLEAIQNRKAGAPHFGR